MNRKNDEIALTNATTDSESGVEGLSDDLERKKSIRALEDMFKRGLIPKDIYEHRLSSLKSK